jgi:hypothetical protein
MMEPARWTVSTLPRALGIKVAAAAVAAMIVGALAHGGDRTQPGGGSASAALLSPLALAFAAAAAAVTFTIMWLKSARLEGGVNWIRRLRPAPHITIQIDEVVHVTRTRPRMASNAGGSPVQVGALAFTLRAADGRTIRVGEGGVMREPQLPQIYEAAMARVVAATLSGLEVGEPYVAGEVTLDGRTLTGRTGGTLALADIAVVIVEIGTTVEVSIVDRMQRPGPALPDDELLLRMLAQLGIAIEYRLART